MQNEFCMQQLQKQRGRRRKKKEERRRKLPELGGVASCAWWWRLTFVRGGADSHDGAEVVVVGENDERKKRLTGENNLGWGLIFLPSLGSHFFLFRTWNPLLFIGGVKERYFVFTGVKSWLLIRIGRIPTVNSKLPSWTIRFWQLKIAWVDLFRAAPSRLWCQSTMKDYTRV